MKVFHLTYWHPNKHNANEAVWIRRHIDSLAPHVQDQFTFHFEIKSSNRFFFDAFRLHKQHSSIRCSAPIPWCVVEVISFIGLVLILFTKARRYDVVNVHIAYPLLTYFHLVKNFFPKPVVLTEHWSGYHFNLGTTRPLPRVQRIFRNNLPLITVSHVLRRDVERFSGQRIQRSCVVPNAIDSRIFYRRSSGPCNGRTFFMLSHWKRPKRPDIVLRAFAKFILEKESSDFQLRIGGDGPQLAEIEQVITSLGIKGSVSILGSLSSASVAREMEQSAAFVHCSEYETFSVVCGEAICCGTPVIASSVGAIPEFIQSENGILVSENTIENWLLAFHDFTGMKFNRDEISKTARQKLSAEIVGETYVKFLKDCETV